MDATWVKLEKRRGFLFVKYFILFLLALIGLLAIIFIGIGGGAAGVLSHFSTMFKYSLPAGVITIGFFFLVIAILGFVGILRKDPKVFIAFLILFFIFLIAQFGVAGGAYGMRDKVEPKVQQAWSGMNSHDRHSIEKYFVCCGYHSWNETDTLCSNQNSTVIDGTHYASGCNTKLVDTVKSQLTHLGAASIAFALLQLITILIGVSLFIYVRLSKQFVSLEENAQ